MERLLSDKLIGIDFCNCFAVRRDMIDVIARQAKQYRLKAEEVRVTADGTRDLVCRDALRHLADGYDRLAGNLERVASRDGPHRATGS